MAYHLFDIADYCIAFKPFSQIINNCAVYKHICLTLLLRPQVFSLPLMPAWLGFWYSLENKRIFQSENIHVTKCMGIIFIFRNIFKHLNSHGRWKWHKQIGCIVMKNAILFLFKSGIGTCIKYNSFTKIRKVRHLFTCPLHFVILAYLSIVF